MELIFLLLKLVAIVLLGSIAITIVVLAMCMVTVLVVCTRRNIEEAKNERGDNNADDKRNG